MSYDKTKVDNELGKKVEEHLKSVGMQTPTTFLLDREAKVKIQEIEFHTKKIWETLGMDLTDDSLENTPNRIAKMMVLEHYWGLLPENFPKITTIDNKMDAGMVVEKNIKVMSNCEHHGVVIDGVACVAYIPRKKVIGLSKLNRIVNFFSRRPQVQERLTNQIWHTLSFILGTEDVAVYLDAVHFCVRSRGVEDANSSTVTSRLGGSFKSDAACRAEFMSVARSMK